MAGDWIKMRSDLHTHPKVVRIASALGADKFRVIGGLHAVWSIFDAHSEDGLLEGYTPEAMDDAIGWPGFCAAMQCVSWLVHADGEGLEMPEFDEHNGQSAKRRDTESKRKRKARAAEEHPQDDLSLSASDADKKRTREEKRREEKEIPPQTPKGEGRFVEFWEAWPKSTRKGGRAECLKVWQSSRLDGAADAILAHVRAMRGSTDWLKDEGKFIPAPVVYLRGKRWDGAEVGGTAPAEPDIFAGAV
ncbi:hypothetical protein [Caldimonas brevitalea]|uniref:Primosomal protein n=1 Tax=Caldimonas brevitalea TaxID=413882 RepID=A0A0G3BN58_9BURK|nr:hypothetical protein [Caldimonas brevitalea]AKJ28781.1 primosomal protein [Caldimonas brevitalea]